MGPYEYMHLTPSWVHVRFTDPYGLFATDSDEHYDSLCDMGSEEGEIPRIPMQQEQHPQILIPID